VTKLHAQLPRKGSPAVPARSSRQHASPGRTASAIQLSRTGASPALAPDIVHEAIRRPGLPLDAGTRSFMESRLGARFGHVRVHADGLAAASAEAVGAAAYTVGDTVVFGAGRYAPHTPRGRTLLAHELVHTLQQQASDPPSPGRPLTIEPSAGPAEHEAAQVGSVGSTAFRIRSRLRAAAVQRAIPTWGGKWTTDNYSAVQDVDWDGTPVAAAQNYRGADITLRFKPNDNVNAELLGLTQTVRSYRAGTPVFPPGPAASRAIPAAAARGTGTGRETDEGTQIDRASGYTSPIYPVNTAASTSLADTSVSASWGQLGWRYTDSANKDQRRDATLIDHPRIPGGDKNSRQEFEVTALATKGVDSGTFYGSVRWGWRTDGSGTLSKIDLQKVSDGAPSSTFLKASRLWDTGKTGGHANVPLNAPTIMVTLVSLTLRPDAIVMLPILLPTGTRVRTLSGFTALAPNVGRLEVVDGPHTGVRGRVDAPPGPTPVLRVERP
jgi:hypothetical protein